MDTKLTLKMDRRVIEKAKKYAAGKQRSLSKIVEAYLQALTTGTADKGDIEISPFVKSMATGKSIPADLDYKKEYSDRLIEKYK